MRGEKSPAYAAGLSCIHEYLGGATMTIQWGARPHEKYTLPLPFKQAPEQACCHSGQCSAGASRNSGEAVKLDAPVLIVSRLSCARRNFPMIWSA